MKCRELKEASWDYFEGRLSEERRAEYDVHAESCPECDAFVKVCREISCEGLTEFLDDYLDGVLVPERKAVFERHLAICEECVAYLDSYSRTRDLTESLAKDAPDPDVPTELLRAILDARDEP